MDNWVGWLLFWALGVVTPFLIRSSFPRGRGREGEVYEDADSQLLNLELRSRWHNMGFWDEGVDEFPTACAQLARKVAGAAGLRKGERICVSSPDKRGRQGANCWCVLGRRLWERRLGAAMGQGVLSSEHRRRYLARRTMRLCRCALLSSMAKGSS